MKLSFYISGVLLIVYLLTSISSFAQTGGQAAQVTDSLKTATITVSGITCSGDLKMIKDRLVKQAGIDECVLSSTEKGKAVFQVGYHTSVVSESQVQKYIEGTPSCDAPGVYPYKVKNVAYTPVNASSEASQPKQ
jgi:hypothetical protein